MSEILNYIRRRIDNNANFLAAITGQTGSGKSWYALSMAEKLDPQFTIEQIVFSNLEFVKLVNSGKLKKGSCIIYDESGVGSYSRNFQSKENKEFNFLTQTYRHRNLVTFFCLPNLGFLDKHIRSLLHYHFVMQHIDRNRSISYAKPFLIKSWFQTGEPYYQYPTIVRKGVRRRMVRYYMNMPCKELIKAYEDKKLKYTDTLNKNIELKLEGIEYNQKNMPTKSLTERQQQIYKLHRRGRNQPEIAKLLDLSQPGVHKTLKAIQAKGFVI